MLSAVKVTGALLAEAASVEDGKLDVRGGFLRHFHVGPDRTAEMTLIVFTEFEDGDTTPKVTVGLMKPSGDSQEEQIDVPVPSLAPGGEVAFAFWSILIPVEDDGKYLLEVRGDKGAVSLPLTVQS
jgi:hypothetical protein